MDVLNVLFLQEELPIILLTPAKKIWISCGYITTDDMKNLSTVGVYIPLVQ